MCSKSFSTNFVLKIRSISSHTLVHIQITCMHKICQCVDCRENTRGLVCRTGSVNRSDSLASALSLTQPGQRTGALIKTGVIFVYSTVRLISFEINPKNN